MTRARAREAGLTTVELTIAVAVVALLAAIAIPSAIDYRQRVLVKQAVLDIRTMQTAIEQRRSEFSGLPNNLSFIDPLPLDPWGNPYAYLNLQSGDPGINGQRRRDKNMNPVNTDYDLFSLGPNGKAFAGIGDQLSLDDVIRANNGGYFGVASEY